MVLPDRPILVVSPHLDDAALSAWSLINNGPSVSVLNVFCAPPEPVRHTEWDRRCGFADSDAAVAARREEDRRALAPVPASVVHLELVEGQYLRGPRSAEDRQAIVGAVRAWCADTGGILALPAGAGWTGHNLWARLSRIRWLLPALPPNPDHIFVRDLLLDARGDGAVWLYEELPYLWSRRADDAVARVADQRRARALPRSFAVDRRAKAAAVGEYRSQVPGLRGRRWMRRIDDPRGLPRFERYWELTPS